MAETPTRRSYTTPTRRQPASIDRTRRPSRARSTYNSHQRHTRSVSSSRQRPIFAGGSRGILSLMFAGGMKRLAMGGVVIVCFVFLLSTFVLPLLSSQAVPNEADSEQRANNDSDQLQNASGLARTANFDAPSLLQNPELPTGCESVALTDALIFKGFSGLSKTDIADYWLPKSDDDSNDFVNFFMGDPRSPDGNACMSPAIERAASDYLDAQHSDLKATNLTGSSFQDILREVAQNNPVLIWATIDMNTPGNCYRTKQSNGRTYRLFDNTHCLMVSGYDLNSGMVNVSDPLKGKVSYRLKTIASRFYAMGSQAIVIK